MALASAAFARAGLRGRRIKRATPPAWLASGLTSERVVFPAGVGGATPVALPQAAQLSAHPLMPDAVLRQAQQELWSVVELRVVGRPGNRAHVHLRTERARRTSEVRWRRTQGRRWRTWSAASSLTSVRTPWSRSSLVNSPSVRVEWPIVKMTGSSDEDVWAPSWGGAASGVVLSG